MRENTYLGEVSGGANGGINVLDNIVRLDNDFVAMLENGDLALRVHLPHRFVWQEGAQVNASSHKSACEARAQPQNILCVQHMSLNQLRSWQMGQMLWRREIPQ